MNMPNTIYPMSKACSFLAINYYEEISNVFEEYLSDVLIPENSSLLNEESSLLLKTDDFYRYPWQKVLYDEEFVVNLVQEARELIVEICKNTVISQEELKLDFDDDITLKSDDFAEEDDLWEEKSLNDFNLDTLLEEFQLLEELPISNSLLKSRPRNPSVLILREELPFIEYEDMFKEEHAISFDTVAAFTEWNPFEVLENSTADDCGLNAEELSLPDLSLNETVCLEQQTEHEVNMETHYSSKGSNSEASLSDNHASFYLFDERKRSINLKENMPSDNSKSAKVDLSPLKVHKLAEKEIFMCPDIEHGLQSFDMYDEKSLWNTDEQPLLRQDIFLKNCLFEKENFLNAKENTDNIAALFNVQQDSGCHENNMSTFSNSVPKSDPGNIIENLEESCTEQEMDNNIKCYKSISLSKTSMYSTDFNEEEALSEDMDIDQFFNSILQNPAKTLSPYDKITDVDQCIDLQHSRISTNICAKPSVILEESIGSENFENIKNEGTQEIADSNKKLFLEKLSGLSWNKEIEAMKPKNDISNFEDTKESKVSIAYRDKKPLNYLSNTRKQSPSEMASFSQNTCSSNQSNSMDMLSAFLLSKKSRTPQKLNNINASSGSSDCGVSVTFPQDVNKFMLTKDLTYFQPNSNYEKLCAEPEIYVQDLHVTLPDEYKKIVLLYETYAVPFIQKLLLSNKFPVSLNFMLTDIPSYKTCFLLNQEVKQCQDKMINPVSEGRGENFYIPLLCLHGILKSMECFIQFDPELAVACLSDFEKSHMSLLKCSYKNLVKDLSCEVSGLLKTYPVHPKIKELVKILKEKCCFCKQNGLQFKVLIILKQYLKQFYSLLHSAVKADFCEFTLEMIPENAFLFFNTLVFKKDGNYVFIASSSSLSNDIPLKDLQIVIEFEEDDNSCWKRLCKEFQVQHAFVKVNSLALKTLQEIKHLNLTQNANKDIISLKRSMLLFVSDAITAQNEILYSLESKSDIILCEKRYKKILPHIYFADVTIDEKTAVILVDQSEFHENNTLHNTINQVEHLHLKYDICWIIFKEFKGNIDISLSCKIRENTMLFSCAVINFCQEVDSYKVKILFASKATDIVDFIKHISSVVYRNKKNTFDYKPSSQSEITEQEIFLASFPSLNPLTVYIMVSSTRISHLLNMSYFQLCQKFFPIPERFLKCFYSTVHKIFNLTEYPIKENIYESLKNFKNNSCNTEGKKFIWEPNRTSEINFLPLSKHNENQDMHFPECSEIDISNSLQESSAFKLNNEFTYLNTHERTLEDIDRDYLSLTCTVAPHNLYIVSPKSKNKIRDDHYSYNDDEHHSYSDEENSVYGDEEQNFKDEENCRYREEELFNFRDKGNFLPCTSTQSTQNSILAESATEFPFDETRTAADVKNCIGSNFNIFGNAETKIQKPLDVMNNSIFIDEFYKRDEGKNSISSKLVNHYSLNTTKISPENEYFDNDKTTSQSQTGVKEVLNLKQFSYMPRKKLKLEKNNSISPKFMSHFSLSTTKTSPKNGSFDNNKITSPSQTDMKKVLNQKQFLYIPRKKLKSSDHTTPKDHNVLSCSPSSPLEKCFRIQKGAFSKTVEKQDLESHISVKSDIFAYDNNLIGFEASRNSGNSLIGPANDFMRTRHEFSNTEAYSKNDFSQLSDSPLVSMENISLTPRQIRRLGYEKLPGYKGQTRLVFQ